MARYLFSRLIALVPILFGTSIVAFFLSRLVPGDPAIALLGLDADPQTIAALRRHLALDQPIVVQYVTWIGRIFEGDFGRSVQGARPVLPGSALQPCLQPNGLVLQVLVHELHVGRSLVLSGARRQGPGPGAVAGLSGGGDR